jgi:hypothetical protein
MNHSMLGLFQKTSGGLHRIFMILRKTQIKQTAILLTLLYLFLSSHILVGGEWHALEHARRTSHTARHASLICAWMCSASTSVHSANPNLDQSFNPSFENLAVSTEAFSNHLSVFYFYGRSPPVVLS